MRSVAGPACTATSIACASWHGCDNKHRPNPVGEAYTMVLSGIHAPVSISQTWLAHSSSDRHTRQELVTGSHTGDGLSHWLLLVHCRHPPAATSHPSGQLI